MALLRSPSFSGREGDEHDLIVGPLDLSRGPRGRRFELSDNESFFDAAEEKEEADRDGGSRGPRVSIIESTRFRVARLLD